jgi:hypothetical protein
MLDQRRHQRIRFSVPQKISIGYGGEIGEGASKTSPVRLDDADADAAGNFAQCRLRIQRFRLAADRCASRCGQPGLRPVRGAFPAGPISQILIDDAISAALASGKASILSVHELGGRKTMRITGGLCGILRSDFMHALTRMGVDEIDLEGVTAVEQAGLALCLVAANRHRVTIGAQSPCFAEAGPRH